MSHEIQSETSFQLDVPLHVASRYNGLAIDSPISPQRHTPDTLAGLVHYTFVLNQSVFRESGVPRTSLRAK